MSPGTHADAEYINSSHLSLSAILSANSAIVIGFNYRGWEVRPMANDKSSSTSKSGVDRWNATEKKSSRSRQQSRKGGSGLRNPQVRRYQFTLLALVVLLVACAVAFVPPAERITQGLDIRGGVGLLAGVRGVERRVAGLLFGHLNSSL